LKKLIAFDLDGTLAPSKSALPDSIAEQIRELLTHKQVCVISGGKFAQFEVQLIGNLQADNSLLHNLHIMPTCGTRYFRFDDVVSDWKQLYAEDIEEPDKKKIISALEEGIDALGLREAKPWGELIEDRGSQITFSGRGQDAPIEIKVRWDHDQTKRNTLVNLIKEKIPQYEISIGGTTSIDITRKGVDKAYAIRKIKEMLKIQDSDIQFIGDALFKGGNDSPVKKTGVDYIQSEGPDQTIELLTKYL